jgi:hypothetical protein
MGKEALRMVMYVCWHMKAVFDGTTMTLACLCALLNVKDDLLRDIAPITAGLGVSAGFQGGDPLLCPSHKQTSCMP